MIFPSLTVTENILTGARGKIEQSVWDEIAVPRPARDAQTQRRQSFRRSAATTRHRLRARPAIPKVLVLDTNPPEGHQPLDHRDIAKALTEIRKMRKLAIIVSEQVVSFAWKCDRALVIERGRFIHEAPREGLTLTKSKHRLRFEAQEFSTTDGHR